MLQVGFEPMIPVFQQAKTVHALDRMAAVIGLLIHSYINYEYGHVVLLFTCSKYLEKIVISPPFGCNVQ
jgi:hypothetical protein